MAKFPEQATHPSTAVDFTRMDRIWMRVHPVSSKVGWALLAYSLMKLVSGS